METNNNECPEDAIKEVLRDYFNKTNAKDISMDLVAAFTALIKERSSTDEKLIIDTKETVKNMLKLNDLMRLLFELENLNEEFKKGV